ncbi:signal recognition particle protein [Clostridium grantii]|uniref:Signal recognition particle protein n=1 Tax=Clostridium grantii DSM 8605 TaxID=1121316 RepID=A0A1M5QV47_9CLOT|nr:signal recognition particle protein [Clostridium grantii]SHH17972.1 signal recognition particle subunit FFH/SRP54 (srp54) [Clostridium grantii DSM 8605]
MAFEGLSSKLQDTFKKLRGKGKLSEKDIKSAMREVKLALLEADVNYKIVKNFISTVSEKSMGEEVMRSLTPAQHVIKIVNEELTELMGSTESRIEFNSTGITVIMLAGLQGAGKTTMAGKLAVAIKKQNKRPLLVACDIYRPAAIKQLEILGKQVEVPVFSMGDKENPVNIAKKSMEYAKENGLNVVIVDTAGRLHIDEKLMDELKDVKAEVNPNEILLVVDSMTGQDAVNVAETFNESLEISGVILTKLDGDTRGGAALSIKAVTGKPIKYIGVGEKLNDLEVFYPERMSSRILGMGDVLTLIEKAQESIDEEKAKNLSDKMMKAEFDLEDFLESMAQMKKLGPMSKLIEMVPGVNTKQLEGVDLGQSEKEMKKMEAIIQSMTSAERRNPNIVSNSASRKRRIAIGSGTKVQNVNKLLKDYQMMKKMMKQFKGGSKKGLGKGMFGKLPFM